MKKILLFAMMIVCGIAVMAQFRPAKISNFQQYKSVLETPAIDAQNPFIQKGNPVVNTKSVLDDIIGVSGVYDMQSNGSPMERVVCWPDGSVAAAWIKSDVTGYADRGTGYNYYDGTTWGAAPATRVETVKTGWPNMCIWNGNGELIVAHNSLSTLVLSTRATKGTGAWTQTLAPTGPIGSAGNALNLLWPRAITNGSNHQNIHIICLTMPVANGGIAYKGMDGAFLYYRSLDGGTTWDKQAVQLPTLDSIHYNGFSGDDYSWIEPHGDTIAFLQGSCWNGTFMMKSFDNGNTWTKQDIIIPYHAKRASTEVISRFYGCDGTMAGAMDHNGIFQIALGRGSASQDAAGSYFGPGVDGVIYWNSTETPLDTAMLSNFDSIVAHHKMIGFVAANANPNDTIIAFPYYKGGLSSYPSVTIDQYNNIYFLWSSVTVGNPDPTPYNYRHVWGRAWFNGAAQWSEMLDLNSDFLYIFQEFAYPEVSKTIKNNNLLLLTQTSSQPGSNVAAGTTYPPVPVHEVSFAYREIPTSTFIPIGIPPAPAVTRNYVGQNFPNPVKGTTSFAVKVDKAATIVIEVSNIMGQKVMFMDKGLVNAGTQKFTIDCNSLTSGIYFYTVKINGESYTHKMIVE